MEEVVHNDGMYTTFCIIAQPCAHYRCVHVGRLVCSIGDECATSLAALVCLMRQVPAVTALH